MNPGSRAELEEERAFLLRSITDLDREHDAGDVDDADYHTLRDGYIARAASVLRALEHDQVAASAAPRRGRGRLVMWIVGTVAVAALSGWLVAHFSGQRAPGQTITGGIPGDEVPIKLAEARSLLGTDPATAAKRYTEVLDLDPGNAEALTYSGWLVAIQGFQQNVPELIDVAATTLRKAIDADPTYADPHCLLAVALGRFAATPDTATAKVEAQACLDNNPPAEMVGLVQQFLAGLDTTTTGLDTTTTGLDTTTTG